MLGAGDCRFAARQGLPPLNPPGRRPPGPTPVFVFKKLEGLGGCASQQSANPRASSRQAVAHTSSRIGAAISWAQSQPITLEALIAWRTCRCILASRSPHCRAFPTCGRGPADNCLFPPVGSSQVGGSSMREGARAHGTDCMVGLMLSHPASLNWSECWKNIIKSIG